MSNSITKLNKHLKGVQKKVEPCKERSALSKGAAKMHSTGSVVEEMLRNIYRLSSVAICISSPDGTVIMANNECCRFLGYTENELKGLLLEEITHPDDLERANRFREMVRSGDLSANSREERFLRKDGSTTWGQVSDNRFYGKDGATFGLITVIQDINDKKLAETTLMKAEARLAARVVELEAANSELESFNYSVSHDLRSPLTTIGGFCELLLGLGKSHLDDQCKSIIRHMRGTVRHMDQLIESLLNFSRISNRDLKREQVNLSLIVNTVASQLKMRDPHRQVEFNIADKLLVEGDAKLLREVMENLLDNAWKYTGKQEKARIEFGRRDINGSPAYYIRDNGPGFDMAQADRLFIPFHRLHSREEFAGYGIGLSTTQRIILRHGGKIWAEGEPGRGATFYFIIPEQV